LTTYFNIYFALGMISFMCTIFLKKYSNDYFIKEKKEEVVWELL